MVKEPNNQEIRKGMAIVLSLLAISVLLMHHPWLWLSCEPARSYSAGRPNTIDLACWHEAGHAVACMAQGIEVNQIEIYANGDGVTTHGVEREPAAAVIVDLAGFEATKLFMLYEDWTGPSSDFKDARHVMKWSEIWSHEPDTARLLLERKEAVTAIARELKANRYMSGDRAKALFENSPRLELPQSFESTLFPKWSLSSPPQEVIDASRTWWDIHAEYLKLTGIFAGIGAAAGLLFYWGMEWKEEREDREEIGLTI